MTKRQCFYVNETMRTEHGYIPSMVTEGEAGFAPLSGNGDQAQPWYWGHDLARAKQIAAESNAELGLTEDDVRAIVLSSLAAGR
ncbi:MAG: hypothetical protein ABWZ30_00950 [Jiangellaceae bacterium]